MKGEIQKYNLNMGNKVREMVVAIFIFVGAIFIYHISFVKEFCKTDTRNYLAVKIKERKCAKGIINFLTNNYEAKKTSLLPPWAK